MQANRETRLQLLQQQQQTAQQSASQRTRPHGDIIMPSKMIQREDGKWERLNTQTIEERSFQLASMMVECHFTQQPPIGRKSVTKAVETIRKTMEKSLNDSKVREDLAKNVDIWLRIKACLVGVIPTLATRSVREAYAETVLPGAQLPESSALITENYASLLEDLTIINNLLVTARNMLAIKEVAQDICAATQLDRQVTKLMVICVNVTSKGYDVENVDANIRRSLNDITDNFKRVLVTCLQFLHNLTMGNDRLKMIFWSEMMFDSDYQNEPIPESITEVRVDLAHEEVCNWLKRNNIKAPMAEALLEKHAADVLLGNTAGPLPPDDLAPLSKIENSVNPTTEAKAPADFNSPALPLNLAWNEEAKIKEEQDRMYGRVSHEIDIWWKRVRDANYENWVVPMETVDSAISRAQACKDNAMTRYIPRVEQDTDLDLASPVSQEDDPHRDDCDDTRVTQDGGRRRIGYDGTDSLSLVVEEGNVEEEDEEEDDEDDSYDVEGPLRGLLTEIPNILDTKQIEALHMTVKACIVDAMGAGLTKSGENLQKTRCKMFLALECGKNLLREMLVFIAVWEQAETQFIFQITAQIVESFHHNALLPYAWKSLKIIKDIVSPAQTVLLRLINYMFRARANTKIYTDTKDYNRDAKLIHFLYNYFRCRVVPDCITLIYAQAQIRNKHNHPQDFPVDLWDMERAKDGLSQYLDFISVIADFPEMRPLLVEWEAAYELIALLHALEAGVERKPLVETRNSGSQSARGIASTTIGATAGTGKQERSADTQKTVADRVDPNSAAGSSTAPAGPQSLTTPSLPPLHDTPHKFPWSGIKVQILVILTSLVAPENSRSGPGNATVQHQILEHGGVLALLNCCVYDGHNDYLKERATLCIKWVMDGCEEAKQFVRDLKSLHNQSQQGQASEAGQAPAQTHVQDQVQSAPARAQAPSGDPDKSVAQSSDVVEAGTNLQNLNLS